MSSVPGRSNGLPAARYTPLVDLAPHFADALLEALRDEGVAAYAAPSPGVRGPSLDVRLPNRPTDRVWVDAGASERAHHVLDARLAEYVDAEGEVSARPLLARPVRPGTDPSPADTDAAWRAIVAGYDRTGTEPVPRWPTVEDFAEPADGSGDGDSPDPGSSVVVREPADGGWEEDAPDDEDAPAAETEQPTEDDEGHYEPPPPPPLPRLDLNTKLSWLGLLGGPLYLIFSAWLGWSLFEGAELLAIGAFVGGFASLVYRMKDRPDEDDPGDDGAVV